MELSVCNEAPASSRSDFDWLDRWIPGGLLASSPSNDKLRPLDIRANSHDRRFLCVGVEDANHRCAVPQWVHHDWYCSYVVPRALVCLDTTPEQHPGIWAGITNRWTGATGSEFRIERDPANLFGNAVARSTQALGASFFNKELLRS